jgi:hypothetical protein
MLVMLGMLEFFVKCEHASTCLLWWLGEPTSASMREHILYIIQYIIYGEKKKCTSASMREHILYIQKIYIYNIEGGKKK